MFGNPYQYSGLGRFASVGEFNPSAYVPHIYRPSLLNVPTAATYQPPVLNTGLLGSDPYGGGGGTGPGTPGGLGADASTPSTPGSVTPGQASAIGAIGGPVGMALGGLVGLASQNLGTTPIGGPAGAAGDSAATGGGVGSTSEGSAAVGAAGGNTGEGGIGTPGPGDGGGGGGGGK